MHNRSTEENAKVLIKGSVPKVTTMLQEVKGEVLEERELDRYVLSIKILNRHGEIRELT